MTEGFGGIKDKQNIVFTLQSNRTKVERTNKGDTQLKSLVVL